MFFPDQTECKDINQFISCYNQVYFYDKNTSVVAENLADDLLKKSKFEPIDVFNILAWKVDGIDTNSTISIDSLKYKRSWRIEDDKFFGDNIYHKLKIDRVITYISEKSEKWLAHWDNKEIGFDPEYAQNVVSDILRVINEQTETYIGEVYIITLLYFVTKGRWPIFDQFASIAINAMNSESMNPYDIIKDAKLPSKNTTAFSKHITSYGVYVDYLDFLKELQSQSIYQYVTSRDIDRALWAYGHAIKKWYTVKMNSEK